VNAVRVADNDAGARHVPGVGDGIGAGVLVASGDVAGVGDGIAAGVVSAVGVLVTSGDVVGLGDGIGAGVVRAVGVLVPSGVAGVGGVGVATPCVAPATFTAWKLTTPAWLLLWDVTARPASTGPVRVSMPALDPLTIDQLMPSADV
jgi:hypothetical protein